MDVVVEPPYARFWLLCRDMSNNSLSGQIPESLAGYDLFFLWAETCIRYMCELKYTIVLNSRDHKSLYQSLQIPLYWSPWPCGDVLVALWHLKDTENTLLRFFSSDIWMIICWMEASPTPWGTAQVWSICKCYDVLRVHRTLDTYDDDVCI